MSTAILGMLAAADAAAIGRSEAEAALAAARVRLEDVLREVADLEERKAGADEEIAGALDALEAGGVAREAAERMVNARIETLVALGLITPTAPVSVEDKQPVVRKPRKPKAGAEETAPKAAPTEPPPVDPPSVEPEITLPAAVAAAIVAEEPTSSVTEVLSTSEVASSDPVVEPATDVVPPAGEQSDEASEPVPEEPATDTVVSDAEESSPEAETAEVEEEDEVEDDIGDAPDFETGLPSEDGDTMVWTDNEDSEETPEEEAEIPAPEPVVAAPAPTVAARPATTASSRVNRPGLSVVPQVSKEPVVEAATVSATTDEAVVEQTVAKEEDRSFGDADDDQSGLPAFLRT